MIPFKNLFPRDTEFNSFKINSLKVTCLLVFLSQLFYFIRYIIAHEQYAYAASIFPCLVLDIFSLYLAFKKKYGISSCLILFSASTCVAILIGSVGGFLAPGLQWLVLIPLIFGALLGKKGLTIGSIVFVCIIIIYSLVDLPNFIPTHEQFLQEKLVNFFAFSLFMLGTIYAYLNVMTKYEKDLQDKNTQINNLLRILLHDISNPAQILGLSIPQIKSDISLDDHDRLTRCYDTIASIISDVKKLQVLNDNKKSLNFKKTKIHNIFSDLDFLFSNLCDEKNIKLEISNNIAPTQEISTDVSILKNQVINNLLTNAIKFSPLNETILIQTAIEKNQLLIKVIDHGAGIDIKNLDNLFNFTKSTSTKGTNGETGTGYGLPLANAFTEKLNGTIEVYTEESNSKIKKGTCFIVKLPLN